MCIRDRLKLDWANSPRWAGITRSYSAEDVVRLRGTIPVEHSIARHGAEKLWKSLHHEDFVNALGALTGNQAMQQVKAGLKAIYLSGWQVAADANGAGEMYPDQSLYPVSYTHLDVYKRQRYELRPEREQAVLLVRPRGWHLDEKHVLVDDARMSAALFDAGLFCYHNAHVLAGKARGPYFYLPKLQSMEEAALWEQVFAAIESALGLPLTLIHI